MRFVVATTTKYTKCVQTLPFQLCRSRATRGSDRKVSGNPIKLNPIEYFVCKTKRQFSCLVYRALQSKNHWYL